MKKFVDNIDTFQIAFYADIEGYDNNTLVVLRNKKVIKEFFGKEAEQLYNLLVKKK